MRIPGSLSPLVLVSFLVGAFGLPTQLPAQKKTGRKPPAARKEIPDEHRVEITGRLISKDKSPIAGMHVMVCEAVTDREKGTLECPWVMGTDGRLANPDATTDKAGRFRIVADRRFWEKSGEFTLSGDFLPRTTTNAGLLTGPGKTPMTIRVDKGTRNVDLGEIPVGN
ncbi:MAG TPA: hypothetical protein VGB47_11380 [Thermoanaerobaculia bacterium]|jgi:hypothetical protein